MTKVIKLKKAHNGWFAILDIYITIFSYFLAYFLTNLVNKDYFSFSSEYVIMLLLIIPTWGILLHTHNLTQIPRTRSFVSMFFNLLNFSFVGFVLMFLYKHLFSLTNFSHFVIFSFSIVNLVSLYLFRMAIYRIFKYFRANGLNVSNVIVYADDRSDEFLDAIIKHKEWGFRILMIISDSMFIKKKYGQGIRIYSDKININNILDIDIIDEVIYCKSSIDDTKLDNLIETCKEIGVTFRLQSDLSPLSAKNVHLTHFQHVPFITFKNKPRNSLALLFKSLSEFWISFGIIFLLSPVMLFISILIKATLKGPVIFKQERVGLRGRKFYIYKFRTMVHNAEALQEKLMILNESDGPAFKMKNDPRITLFGRFLRKTGLDELPQLFNVLKGEMSLVGPRPPLQSEVNKYERWHLRRLSVKPGITCTWQVIPHRNQVIFDDWMKLDIQYIKSWSIKKDIILLFRTVKTTLQGTGF
jgi:exopolysaccharide biosynthesis polyprenyl glycosylphosphotransferase